jgi:hypothetical protein
MELQEQEILLARIHLRKKLDLPVESSDVEKIKKIEQESMLKVKEKNPIVPTFFNDKKGNVKIPSFEERPAKKPIVDLDELAKGISEKVAYKKATKKVADDDDVSSKFKEDSGVSSNDEAQKPPTVSKLRKTTESLSNINLTNSDIITLFGNYDTLSEGLKDNLTKFMTSLEETNPERYRELSSSAVPNDVDVEESEALVDEPREVVENSEENAEQEKRVKVLSVENLQLPVPSAELTTTTTVAIPLPVTIPISQENIIDDDDDDYQLENSDVIKRALENAMIIEVPDDDSETIEVVDLTED